MDPSVKVYDEISEEELHLPPLRRGPWTVEEDINLINYVAHHGEGRWNSLARCAGLNRTGKSCRLRWLNYLRPEVRRGNITLEEQLLILELHSRWGNRWSKIAQHLPGRTDNEIKNYWRTRVQKHAKLLKCDVNSKQFKDTVRYHWMPRLVERIQVAAAAAGVGEATGAPVIAPSPTNSTTTYELKNQNYTNLDVGSTQIAPPNFGAGIHTYSPENSSESFGSAGSDLTECYNNYPVIRGNNIDYCQENQICYDDPCFPSSGGYFNQGLDFTEQNQSQWMDGGDVSDVLWDVDDLWFLQEQV